MKQKIAKRALPDAAYLICECLQETCIIKPDQLMLVYSCSKFHFVLKLEAYSDSKSVALKAMHGPRSNFPLKDSNPFL